MKKARTIKKDAARKAEQSVTSKDQAAPQVQVDAESKDDAPLHAGELKKLEYFESTIKTCLGDFVLIGNALKSINKDRLYRDKFKSFEDYCEKQWGFGGKYAYRLINASEVSVALQKDGSIGQADQPISESQVRPLLKLAADKRSDAWKQAVTDAQGSNVTAAVVQKVVNALLGNEKAKTKSSPTKQKLKKIAGLVEKALDESSKLTADQIKEILEEIQGLLGKKK